MSSRTEPLPFNKTIQDRNSRLRVLSNGVDHERCLVVLKAGCVIYAWKDMHVSKKDREI